jgi:hypothetical protein
MIFQQKWYQPDSRGIFLMMGGRETPYAKDQMQTHYITSTA